MSGIAKGPAKMATDQSLTRVMMVFFGGGQVSLNSISIGSWQAHATTCTCRTILLCVATGESRKR